MDIPRYKPQSSGCGCTSSCCTGSSTPQPAAVLPNLLDPAAAGCSCSASDHAARHARSEAAFSENADSSSQRVLRVVFMGTPDFAATILKAVAACFTAEVVGVFVQPDKPVGRGQKLTAPPTKLAALDLGIPVFQPETFSLKRPEGLSALETLRALAPDVLVVAAYGLILPQVVLDIPTRGPYNVHASLLPKYRGAAPIQRAIMNGDAFTGITIMRMAASMDTGPILLQQAIDIRQNDTSASLHDILAEHGAKLMCGALGILAEQREALIPQNDDCATYAPKLTPAEGQICWDRPATVIHKHICGVTPWPGAHCELRMEGRQALALRLEPGVVLPLSCLEQINPELALSLAAQGADGSGLAGLAPGTLLGFYHNADVSALVVVCEHSFYGITGLRPAGKGRQSAADFRNGYLRGVDFQHCLFQSAPTP